MERERPYRHSGIESKHIEEEEHRERPADPDPEENIRNFHRLDVEEKNKNEEARRDEIECRKYPRLDIPHRKKHAPDEHEQNAGRKFNRRIPRRNPAATGAAFPAEERKREERNIVVPRYSSAARGTHRSPAQRHPLLYPPQHHVEETPHDKSESEKRKKFNHTRFVFEVISACSKVFFYARRDREE